MAGIYGPKDFTLTLQDSPGGTARALTLTNTLALKTIARMMNTTALGAEFDTMAPTGMGGVEPIAMEGLWDTTALTGSHIVFESKAADRSPQSVGRELVATVGDGKTFTVTGHLSEYEVRGEAGGDNQRFSAVLTPTGEGVWGP